MIRLSGRKKEKRKKGFLVNVVNLQKKVKIDKKYVQKVASKTIRLGTRDRDKLWRAKSEVGIIFVNDSYIKRLNRKYRRVNSITDVIAFPMEGHGEFVPSMTSSHILGDVFISADRAKVQAKDFKHSVGEEIAILTIHGILHLLNYDHRRRKNALVMRRKEEEILNHIKCSKE